MVDIHKNFAYSTILTAPSPATSGTSTVVQSADGTKFPAVPFNATIWPVGVQPTTANAEIVRVTAISTDTFTITRAQEGTAARTVVVGDQIAATITAKTLTDVEVEGYTTTATAAGTTTLTIASTINQYFTGSTTQTVALPVTSTLVLGQQYRIVNRSTGKVTVNSSGGNNIIVLLPNTSALIICILTSGTGTASWDIAYTDMVKLGITNVTSGAITHTTTETTIASVTIDVPIGGRDVELECIVPQVSSSVASDRIVVKIKESSTILETFYTGQPSNGSTPVYKTTIPAPSAGSHTYIITGQRDIGSGTITWYNDASGATIKWQANLK